MTMAAEHRNSSDESANNGNRVQSKLDGQESLPYADDHPTKPSQSKPKDHWTHSAYNASASFVPS